CKPMTCINVNYPNYLSVPAIFSTFYQFRCGNCDKTGEKMNGTQCREVKGRAWLSSVPGIWPAVTRRACPGRCRCGCDRCDRCLTQARRRSRNIFSQRKKITL